MSTSTSTSVTPAPPSRARPRTRTRYSSASGQVTSGGLRGGDLHGSHGCGREHPHAHPDSRLVDVESRLVQVDRAFEARRPDAKAPHTARHVVEVPGEVLAAKRLLCRHGG